MSLPGVPRRVSARRVPCFVAAHAVAGARASRTTRSTIVFRDIGGTRTRSARSIAPPADGRLLVDGKRQVPCAAVDPATLDAWLPEFAVRTRHRRRSPVAPERLWAAANEVCMSETHSLGRLVRWRIPDTRTDQTFGELLAAYPFCVLNEGEHWSISGLCGRIWTLQRDYPRLEGPEDFRAWSEPGTVRVLI